MLDLGSWLELGYIGLFIVSLISATIIPAATEAVMLAMTGLGFSLVGLLIVATAGNVAGAFLNYTIGLKGMDFIRRSRFAPDPERLEKIQAWFKRWGTSVLFFSWLPLIGDPMTIVAGLVKIPLRTFFFWVLVGRFLRYAGILLVGDSLLKLVFA